MFADTCKYCIKSLQHVAIVCIIMIRFTPHSVNYFAPNPIPFKTTCIANNGSINYSHDSYANIAVKFVQDTAWYNNNNNNNKHKFI